MSRLHITSVHTRAMEPVWPDLVKFCIIGQILKLFGNILRVYLVLGENSNFFGKQLSQSSNFQCFKFPIIKTNLATWSHWMELTEWLKRKEAESFLQFFFFLTKNADSRLWARRWYQRKRSNFKKWNSYYSCFDFSKFSMFSVTRLC